MEASTGSNATDAYLTVTTAVELPRGKSSSERGILVSASTATSILPSKVPAVAGVRRSTYASRPATTSESAMEAATYDRSSRRTSETNRFRSPSDGGAGRGAASSTA